MKTATTSFTSLETERLIVRRFVDNDLDPFLSYLNDPLVAKYQSWESYTEQQARDTIAKQKDLDPGEQGQWFIFALELVETKRLIGHVALKMLDDRQAEIGFTMSREAQGKGLAFEATSAVLEYLFSRLDLHRVVAIADCENTRSVALLSRLGMRREGHFIKNIWFKGKWGDEYLYAILKDEWLNGRPQPDS